LLLEGIYFHLIDCGFDFVKHSDVHKSVRLKVADPNGAQLTGPVSILHGTPRPVHVAIRLVDQIQIEVVEFQAT